MKEAVPLAPVSQLPDPLSVSDRVLESTTRLRASTIPAPADDDSPARDGVSRAAADLLDQVDALGSGASGALVLSSGGREVGALFVEGGRICFGMARGLEKRLSDLLMRRARLPLSRETLDQIIATCRSQGRSLGESLVEAGFLSVRGFRHALLQQTIEALAELACSRPQARFLRHKQASYAPAYTFATAELWCALGAARQPREWVRARRLLEGLPEETLGVVFSRQLGQVNPLAVTEQSEATVSDLMTMTRFGQAYLDLGEAVCPGVDLITAREQSGLAWVALRRGELFCVIRCSDARAQARVLCGF